MGILAVGGTPSLTEESIGGAYGILECTQAHPPGNQHLKGPIYLWVAVEVIESQQELSKWHCSLSDLPPPTYSTVVALPWRIPSTLPLKT